MLTGRLASVGAELLEWGMQSSVGALVCYAVWLLSVTDAWIQFSRAMHAQFGNQFSVGMETLNFRCKILQVYTTATCLSSDWVIILLQSTCLADKTTRCSCVHGIFESGMKNPVGLWLLCRLINAGDGCKYALWQSVSCVLEMVIFHGKMQL